MAGWPFHRPSGQSEFLIQPSQSPQEHAELITSINFISNIKIIILIKYLFKLFSSNLCGRVLEGRKPECPQIELGFRIGFYNLQFVRQGLFF